MKFYSKIPKGGKQEIIHQRDMYEKYIVSLGRDDGDVNLVHEISVRKKIRSIPQNKYYRALIKIVVARMYELGHEKDLVDEDSIHDFFKTKFNYHSIINEKTGEYDKIPVTTTKLSTTDFMAYIENIKRWCAEWIDIKLPEPDQQLEIDDNQ